MLIFLKLACILAFVIDGLMLFFPSFATSIYIICSIPGFVGLVWGIKFIHPAVQALPEDSYDEVTTTTTYEDGVEVDKKEEHNIVDNKANTSLGMYLVCGGFGFACLYGITYGLIALSFNVIHSFGAKNGGWWSFILLLCTGALLAFTLYENIKIKGLSGPKLYIKLALYIVPFLILFITYWAYLGLGKLHYDLIAQSNGMYEFIEAMEN